MNKEQQEATERLLSDSEARTLGRSYLQSQGNKNPTAEEEAMIGALLKIRSPRAIETKEFKLTLKNSWWQFLVALLLYKPILIVSEIFILLILGTFDLQLSSDLQSDISDALNIVAIVGVYYIGRHLALQTWKRKAAKQVSQTH